MVHFPSYDGPTFDDANPDAKKVVPIFRATRDFVVEKQACTRTQFPLVLAYAMTIHKAQSASLDKARLNLGARRDFAVGLTYVAISRVRTLQGLLFEEPFDVKCLVPEVSKSSRMRDADREQRSRQQLDAASAAVFRSDPWVLALPSFPRPRLNPQDAPSSDAAAGSEFQMSDAPPSHPDNNEDLYN
jgi:ATP-dependent DNA helicase PIF1